jgi:hypothetical protein
MAELREQLHSQHKSNALFDPYRLAQELAVVNLAVLIPKDFIT